MSVTPPVPAQASEPATQSQPPPTTPSPTHTPAPKGAARAIKDWWSAATPVMQLYCGGLVTGALALASGRIVGFGVPTSGLLLATGLFLAGAFLIEAYAVAKRLWDTSLGKLAGLLIATMVASVAMAISSQLINGATGLDPATVPYAVAFLAPLTAGYLILFGTFLLIFVCIGLALMGFLLDLVHLAITRSWAKDNAELEALRFVGFISLVLLVSSLWEEGHRQYDSSLAGGAKWFVFTFEMYGKDDCALKGEHIRRLNDDVVMVGVANGGTVRFSKRLCPVSQGAADMPGASTIAPPHHE